MALRPQRPPDAQTPACPCRHGDVPAELAGQRPLLERAAAGDREAFALVYDTQVEGVYHYLLAWTGNAAEAAGDVVAAVARLREPEREVVVLRLLLGHSLDHTAHLSAYSRRAVMELQL